MNNILTYEVMKEYNDKLIQMSDEKIGFLSVFFIILEYLVVKNKKNSFINKAFYKKIKLPKNAKKVISELISDTLFTLKSLEGYDEIKNFSDELIDFLEFDEEDENELIYLVGSLSMFMNSYLQQYVPESLILEEEEKSGKILTDEEILEIAAEKIGDKDLADRIHKLLLVILVFIENKTERNTIIRDFEGAYNMLFTILFESILILKEIIKKDGI